METIAEPVLSEVVIGIDEYADKHRITRRTVDRYVRAGKVEKIRQYGKTLVVDKPPIPNFKTSVKSEKSGTSGTVEIEPFVREDWVNFGAARAYAASRHKWQAAFFVVSVLFVLVLMASGIGGTYLYQTNKTLSAQVVAAGEQASQAVTESNAAHAAEVGGLQLRIDELTKANAEKDSQIVNLTARITTLTNQVVELSRPVEKEILTEN